MKQVSLWHIDLYHEICLLCYRFFFLIRLHRIWHFIIHVATRRVLLQKQRTCLSCRWTWPILPVEVKYRICLPSKSLFSWFPSNLHLLIPPLFDSFCCYFVLGFCLFVCLFWSTRRRSFVSYLTSTVYMYMYLVVLLT